MMNIDDNSVDRVYDNRYDCKLQKYRKANSSIVGSYQGMLAAERGGWKVEFLRSSGATWRIGRVPVVPPGG